ncbi:hypothetical protein M427DRAFT_142592 [Gonapodya prolifera JEL478]|uniref:Uncharacterized protein n=1 Tax=Gonapodya prolifera (strain JEL478) TaxID=1344416 RepID=A0A139AWM3_GONPJ|nr:hypothetical protein M427DRAFT_142592 [Gonapodya prolifera JEL478]|eukprot:KXS20875.1 hypothetical protein M427DRAFT_142592 [Gonapodya prolifera JEL478]
MPPLLLSPGEAGNHCKKERDNARLRRINQVRILERRNEEHRRAQFLRVTGDEWSVTSESAEATWNESVSMQRKRLQQEASHKYVGQSHHLASVYSLEKVDFLHKLSSNLATLQFEEQIRTTKSMNYFAVQLHQQTQSHKEQLSRQRKVKDTEKARAASIAAHHKLKALSTVPEVQPMSLCAVSKSSHAVTAMEKRKLFQSSNFHATSIVAGGTSESHHPNAFSAADQETVAVKEREELKEFKVGELESMSRLRAVEIQESLAVQQSKRQMNSLLEHIRVKNSARLATSIKKWPSANAADSSSRFLDYFNVAQTSVVSPPVEISTIAL